jgi:hypothetical protein
VYLVNSKDKSGMDAEQLSIEVSRVSDFFGPIIHIMLHITYLSYLPLPGLMRRGKHEKSIDGRFACFSSEMSQNSKHRLSTWHHDSLAYVHMFPSLYVIEIGSLALSNYQPRSLG